MLKPSIQQDYEYDDGNSDYMENVQELPTTTMETIVREGSTIYKVINISAEIGEDLKIHCMPENGYENVW